MQAVASDLVQKEFRALEGPPTHAAFEILGRLQGIQVDTLGQRVDTDGRVELLVRTAGEALPDEILTTSLPQASTGLRVNVING